jgi:hypothetical protein
MADRAGDSKFSVSEKEKLKRFVALILARRVAARRAHAQDLAPPSAPIAGPVNPSDIDSFGVDASGYEEGPVGSEERSLGGTRRGRDRDYDSDSDGKTRGKPRRLRR